MKTALVLLAFAFAASGSAEVRIAEQTAARPGVVSRSFRVLNGSPVKYELFYSIRTDAKGRETVGDPSAHSIGLGLGSGWYSGGFLRIRVNGCPIMSPAQKIANSGGKLVFHWKEARLLLDFPEGSDRVFGEIVCTSGAAAEITFLAMPGARHGRTAAYVPWISTAAGDSRLAKGPVSLMGGSWCMLYDEVENPRGIAAILADPEQIAASSASSAPGSSMILLHYRCRGQAFRFILWTVPLSHREPEEFNNELKSDGAEWLGELKKHQF